MSRGLYIFPCNGNALEALDCLGEQYEMLGWIDDDPAKQGQKIHGYKVYGRDILETDLSSKVLAVPGNPSNFRTRRSLIESLGLESSRFATVISPTARVSNLAQIGFNCLIMHGVVISSNAAIGQSVCILPNSVVHHDVKLGDFSLLGSQVVLSGGVQVGQSCYVGSASSVKNGVSLGDFALVGMSSNVVKDVPSNAVVMGNPAK